MRPSELLNGRWIKGRSAVRPVNGVLLECSPLSDYAEGWDIHGALDACRVDGCRWKVAEAVKRRTTRKGFRFSSVSDFNDWPETSLADVISLLLECDL